MTDKLFPPNFQESDELLSDLLDEVRRWEGILTGGTKLGVGEAAITNLTDSKISLGNPKDKLTLLTKANFQATGTTIGFRIACSPP